MPHILRDFGCKRDKRGDATGRRINNKKGFTLIEILLVMMIFGVIATMALSTYVKSTGTFDFLSNYKNVLSALRTARVYALTNRQESGIMPARYGVQITANGVIVFAETGPTAFSYDPVETACEGNPCPADPLADQYDPIVKDFDLAATDYQIEAFDSTFNAPDSNLEPPLLIFYEIGSGELTVFQGGNDEVQKNEHKYIVIRVSENGADLERHIVLFLVSGLPEEYDNIESL